MKKDEEQICAFCSATIKPGLVFYKGYLGAYICSECVKSILVLILDNYDGEVNKPAATL